MPPDLERGTGRLLTSPAHNCVIHAARSRAATRSLKKREETLIVFCWVLITPDNANVIQGEISQTTWGWGLGLSAGQCGIKRVVLLGSCELLGKDLSDKDGLEDCILANVQHGSVCGR